MFVKRLLIVAVGGQGNLLASRVLGEAALCSGISVRISEIHGMAQRGGVVESALVFGEAKSNIISQGHADIMLGFEPAETLRAIGKCSPDSTVITNITRIPPFTVSIGKGVYPDIELILALLNKKVKKLIAFDSTSIARDAGNIMTNNMVLIGALTGTGILPISSEHVQEAIKTTVRKAFVDINLKAFNLGFSQTGKQER
jgi:indolepyruvate ferredoxin oxidoreductase, beta subunit